MMKCDNCIKNGICQIKAQFLKMHPLGKIGYCYAFIEKDSEPKPITNGDRIRAMTDEELAKEFEAMASYCAPGTYPNVEICRIERCVECWLGWLKQSAKEETK